MNEKLKYTITVTDGRGRITTEIEAHSYLEAISLFLDELITQETEGDEEP